MAAEMSDEATVAPSFTSGIVSEPTVFNRRFPSTSGGRGGGGGDAQRGQVTGVGHNERRRYQPICVSLRHAFTGTVREPGRVGPGRAGTGRVGLAQEAFTSHASGRPDPIREK